MVVGKRGNIIKTEDLPQELVKHLVQPRKGRRSGGRGQGHEGSDESKAWYLIRKKEKMILTTKGGNRYS